MGIVWQARDERLHRLVAVKQLLLQPDLSPEETEGARQRALREARIAARLQHPNAIVVYDVAEHEGEPCLVMEYLPSRTLGAVLAEQGCLPVTEVASIGRQVASALAAAHAAQIVHRDVKPGNILIADGGTAKITDFGVSRAAGDVTVTQTGMMAGTPAYLAPEVARGQVPTPASDVFSLGATLFAAIEGRAPFGDGENQLALLHAVAAGDVAPPRHAGPLTPTLMSLLAKDPSARPDMRQASLELAAATDSRPVQITRPGTWSPKPAAAATPPPTLASRPIPPPPPLPPPATPPPSPPKVSEPPVRRPAPRPVPRPAASTATRSDPDLRRRAGVFATALLAVLALAVTGGLVLKNMGDQAAAPNTPAPTPSTSAPAPPPAQQAATPQPPATQPVHASEGSIDWSSAGQLVINYYNGLDNPSSAWRMLSTTAQAFFGNEAQFASHWSQYSSVSARNAFGVTDNGDGTVNVPVDVTYHTGNNDQTQKRVLRVTRLGGQLLIDSDPR
ncbi:MAG: serine/threonine-protein kinase [Pseudonocardiaceae bacterium]